MVGEIRLGAVSARITVLMAAVLGLAACSSDPSSTASTRPPAPTPAAVAQPTMLTTSCTTAPSLAPVTPTPPWPSNFQILDAVPGTLATQYPTVYGGEIAAPATPSESAVEINSHLVVFETVHDPALEAEVKAAYPPGITVSFELTPRSKACLNDVQTSVTAQANAAQKAGIMLESSGIEATNQVEVGVSACTPATENAARAWFQQRWGDTVHVQTCQRAATAV